MKTMGRWAGTLAIVIGALYAAFGARAGRPRLQITSAPTEARATDLQPTPGRQPLPASRVVPMQPTSSDDSIAGVVLDERAGAPVENAWVYWSRAAESSVPIDRSVRTASDGTFQLSISKAELSAGVVLTTSATGYAPATIEVPFAGRESDRRPIEIRISVGASVDGFVQDDNGAPVPHARVWAALPSNRQSWPYLASERPIGEYASGAEVHADERGAFHLSGLDRERAYELWASAPHFSSQFSDFPPLTRAGSEGVVVRMRASSLIVVECIDDSDGSPITCSALMRHVSRGVRELGVGGYWVDQGDMPTPPATSGIVVHFGRDGIGQEPAALEVAGVAPGYESRHASIPIVFGRDSVFALRLPRLRGALHPLRMSATWKSTGRAFQGELGVAFHDSTPGLASGAKLSFTDGRSDDSIRLPAGDYVARFGGGPLAANTWWRGGVADVKFTVEGKGEPTTLNLSVEGVVIDLVVRDPRGRIVHGYDLQVNPSGPVGGALFRRWGARRSSGETSDEFLVTGDAVEIWANMPGVGGRRVRQALPTGDGAVVRIEFELIKSEEFDLREFVRGLERDAAPPKK